MRCVMTALHYCAPSADPSLFCQLLDHRFDPYPFLSLGSDPPRAPCTSISPVMATSVA
jgi:hypothetical protein